MSFTLSVRVLNRQTVLHFAFVGNYSQNAFDSILTGDGHADRCGERAIFLKITSPLKRSYVIDQMSKIEPNCKNWMRCWISELSTMGDLQLNQIQRE